MKLHNKIAVITGASRGIGRATALELARHGCDVVFNYFSHDEEASSLVKLIEGLGRRAIALKGDVSDREFDEHLFERAVKTFGGVDILVNNAGIGTRKSFLDLTVPEVERTWAVSLWGVFHCSQIAARQMKKGRSGGAII